MNDTTTTAPRQQGQKLDGFNLQAVLDSGTNAADKGRQQFFTPAAVAAALMTPLGPARRTFIDLTMGTGGLLVGSQANECIGIDIDPRCARHRPEGVADTAGAASHWQTLTADLTAFYPLLAEVNWQFDLCGLNPPFSLRWHRERLAALADSDCPAVAKTFKRSGSGDTIDSTLATFLIALDRMTEKGEGFLICNEATARRFFGEPDAEPEAEADGHDGACPSSGIDRTNVRSHVWLWLTVPPGMFEDVRDFDTAVLYFARSHEGAHPLHLRAPSASAADIEATLRQARTKRYTLRTGAFLYSGEHFSASTVPVFAAAAQEHRRLEKQARTNAGAASHFNLWLDNGIIRRHLTPFQSFSGRIPKDAATVLNKIEGKTPMALALAKETRLNLLRAVHSDYWRVEPALVEAVEAAAAEYNASRAPFYPLNDVQRLGFLDEEDSILCKASGHGFTVGRRYELTCSTEHVSREHTRPNILGKVEQVTLSGQEMAIVITDDAKHKHVFRVQDADEQGAQTDKTLGRTHHHVAELLELFDVPAVPDVAMIHPQKFRANLDRIAEIEAKLQGFEARHFQRDDLARMTVHDGAILSWEPGMGKTIGTFLTPQIKGAMRTLIVAPEQLHQQIIDGGHRRVSHQVSAHWGASLGSITESITRMGATYFGATPSQRKRGE